jgi:imidazolonepropionase-like amidohydrolase
MILASALTLLCAATPVAQEPLTIAVDKLYVGNGDIIENAVVVLADGKIVSVAPGVAADSALHIEGATLTPGLVDAFSFMGVGGATLEESREVTASMKLAQLADLDSDSFRNALDLGVTSAYLSPDSLNVMGGIGAFVKTSGGQPADLFAESAARVLNDRAGLKVTLGGDPSRGNYTPSGQYTTNFKARRPNTRMGTVWVVRRDFYRAKDYMKAREQGLPVYDADLEALAAALRGEIPIRVQARRSHDVETALRLQKELGWPNMIIEEATESHNLAKQLAAADVSVVCGPAYDSLGRSVARGPSQAELKALAAPAVVCCEDLHDHEEGAPSFHEETGAYKLNEFSLDMLFLLAPRYATAYGFASGRRSEGRGSTPALPGLLQAGGVNLSLGGAESHDQSLTESSLIHQARSAVRWGMAPADAIASITSRPATLCGMGDQLGQISSGFDADLVLWSGDPLAADSKPLLVILDGAIVVDNRPQE